jgi:ring-1,2-phenylacetyl-CoA epoxidase subunit PaaD
VVSAAVAGEERVRAAWRVLDGVPDPEMPALSVCELGIVREVLAADDGVLRVVLTPTYSGCPATRVIAEAVRGALADAGLGDVVVEHRLAPAWTTDWISAEGRRKLREAGIAPPALCGEPGHAVGHAVPIGLRLHAVPCPRCGSRDTERLSAFGSTACKALHRCRACLEPFEHFKPL